jgi:hypothetical protein
MNLKTFAKRRVSLNALLVQATALCLCAMPAMAAVVDGPATNIAVPANIDGVYINLVTGATGTLASAVPGWDIDPFQSGGTSLAFFWPSTPATSFGAVSSATTGPYVVLAPGATVSSTSIFSVVTATGTAGTPFVAAGDNYLGFRFFNETTSAINFGYARVQTGASGGFPATIVCYRYEDTGAPITVAPCGPPVPAAPTLTYSPTTAAGVTFPAGVAGSAAASIAITSAGAVGTGQSAVTGCAITGPGAASFGAVTTTPANGIFNTTTTAGSIDLTCTRGSAAATATLACTETATPTVAGSPFTRSWALTCPAATNPASVSAGSMSGALVTLPGITLPASSSARSLSFTSTGGPASVTCTATGAGFSAAPNPLNLTAGVAGTVTVTYTGSAVGTFTGSLTCTTNAAGGPFTYPLSATVTAGAPPAAARTVPSMGAIGTWILVLSVLGMGMLFGARARS